LASGVVLCVLGIFCEWSNVAGRGAFSYRLVGLDPTRFTKSFPFPVLEFLVRICTDRLMSDTPLQAPSPAPLTRLTDEEILFRDNIRQFADDKIRPLAKEMDEKGIFDKELLRQFFQLGLMGIEIPEQYGGGGARFFEAILAVEELSRVDASAGVIIDVQNTLVNNALLRWTTLEQKKRYLPRMAADTCGAYALSEAISGSDAFALQTKAELKGSDYVLNGRKLWITNGKEAGVFLLFATVDPSAGYKGITCFILEKEFPGFTVGKKEDKLGIRASSTCELILEDCHVPKENVVGEVGKGYKIAIETLNEGRIGIGAQMMGVARGAWEYAARYAQERKQFGKSLSEFQGIQFQIAQMATEIEAARLMVYNAARLKDAGVPFVKEAAMTKLFCSQVAERVTSLAIEIYGGYGFTKDYPVEKYWRDSKIGKIYEGTSNMQLATIAKLVMGGK
jgi:alkylation response protein AidB-like acyl-CoA dehydrogenase